MPNDIAVSARGIEPTQAYLRGVRDLTTARRLASRMRFAVLMVHRYLMGLSRDHPPVGQVGVLPVRSGRLKNSLHPTVERRGNSVVGVEGTNLEYAPYVEALRRFLVRTARDMRKPVNDLFAGSIRRRIQRGAHG